MIKLEAQNWIIETAKVRNALSELESKEIAKAYGITVNNAILCKSKMEAITFSSQLGYPVALKVDSSKILHKSEVGGVVLGLKNEDEVAEAYMKMEESLNRKANGIDYNGIAVHVMEAGHFEIIVGAKRDPIFGSVILVGFGGIYAELLKDVEIRLAPLSDEDISEMIDNLKMSSLLKGYRGKPFADIQALRDILLSVSDLMISNPNISEIDLNPVMLGYEGEGAKVVDASFLLKQTNFNTVTNDSTNSSLQINVEKMLQPDSVAVVGASSTSKKIGGRLLNTLIGNKFEGAIYPINKSAQQIGELKAYSSLSNIKHPVDVATLVIPPKAVIESVKECAHLGIKNIIINSSGFSEAGEEGKEIQNELIKLSKELEINIVGPNSQGVINFNKNYYLSFSSVVNSPKVRKGDVCLISQSGAIASAILTRGWELGLGFSHFISTGNEACIGISEFIAAAANDPDVKVIAVFMEGIKSWSTFLEAAEKAKANGKTIVVYKSGKSEVGKKVIGSHTGSLAGEDSVYDIAFRKAGIVRVNEISSLLDTCLALSWLTKYPKGKSIGIISTSGGACSILADEAEHYGITVPEFKENTLSRLTELIPSYGNPQNPVDITAQVLADTEPFIEVLTAVAKDPNIDYLILMLTTNAEPAALEMAYSVIKLYEKIEKPFLICRMGTDDLAPNAVNLYRENCIPVYPSPERLIKSIHYVSQHIELKNINKQTVT